MTAQDTDDAGLPEKDQDAYALVVKGNAMIEDHIRDGDYVVVKPQTTCADGDIVVAVHLKEGAGSSAMLKRFYQEKEHNRIRLQPANSELEPIYISRDEWEREWQIQGKVVAIFRNAGIPVSVTTDESES